MLQEFRVPRGEEYEGHEDSCILIDMDMVEYAYPGILEGETNLTAICMRSGNFLTIRMKCNEFFDIWRTCIEPINLNK
jgi:hypothetical protein